MQLTEQYLHSAVYSVIRCNEINACLRAFFSLLKCLWKVFWWCMKVLFMKFGALSTELHAL